MTFAQNGKLEGSVKVGALSLPELKGAVQRTVAGRTHLLFANVTNSVINQVNNWFLTRGPKRPGE